MREWEVTAQKKTGIGEGGGGKREGYGRVAKKPGEPSQGFVGGESSKGGTDIRIVKTPQEKRGPYLHAGGKETPHAL